MNRSDYPHAARRVLGTINQMFATYFWKTALQPRFEQDPDLRLPSIALENATVESSLIAIRAFDDFVQSNRNRPDDLIASDFHFLAITGHGISASERTRINKQIAHLTKIDLSSERQGFSYRESLAAVVPAAISFCEYVTTELSSDPALICFAQDTKEVCALVNAAYVNRQEAQQGAP
jgi:hypothetical protein